MRDYSYGRDFSNIDEIWGKDKESFNVRFYCRIRLAIYINGNININIT